MTTRAPPSPAMRVVVAVHLALVVSVSGAPVDAAISSEYPSHAGWFGIPQMTGTSRAIIIAVLLGSTAMCLIGLLGYLLSWNHAPTLAEIKAVITAFVQDMEDRSPVFPRRISVIMELTRVPHVADNLLRGEAVRLVILPPATRTGIITIPQRGADSDSVGVPLQPLPRAIVRRDRQDTIRLPENFARPSTYLVEEIRDPPSHRP
ncbi:hypothetical protein OF83DRAFT_50688 [Amylostereum chailletii]|nr:hypothetical protein OF83DRAFT_50688 [Amylostereum chailletii]